MPTWRDDIHAVRVKVQYPDEPELVYDEESGNFVPAEPGPDYVWRWSRGVITVETVEHPNDMDDETLLNHVRKADFESVTTNRSRVPQGDPLSGGAPYKPTNYR